MDTTSKITNEINSQRNTEDNIGSETDAAQLISTENDAMKSNLLHFWNEIRNWDKKNIFMDAVTEDIAPGYFDVVSQPMDLTTVKNKIDTNSYDNIHDFEYDIKLIFTNYNEYMIYFYSTNYLPGLFWQGSHG